MVKGLFLFCNDFRLHDNPALARAAAMSDSLLCVAGKWVSQYNQPPFVGRLVYGRNREAFYQQSVKALYDSMAEIGHPLLCEEHVSLHSVSELMTRHAITHVFRSENAGFDENNLWQKLVNSHPNVQFETTSSHTLFSKDDLPFDLNDLPVSFSKFRRKVEAIEIREPLADIELLPPSPIQAIESIDWICADNTSPFIGGESEGVIHLKQYFSGSLPLSYKQTRNDLDGWDYSTKFSPWLALGCLSVRTIVDYLKRFEIKFGRNESTEWIMFELLWREYFQWYAHSHGHRLFTYQGIKDQTPDTNHCPQALESWMKGQTQYPIVNACMTQLNETGYLSNRGRQLVASCLVNELGLDWRYGALFFEYLLIDYDVGCNWGNWQYLAGVGADQRQKRHFNLQKQAEIYDPDNRYTNRWLGECQ